MLFLFPLVVAAALETCAPADRPLVTEVFYDVIGDDTGHEFVELHNPRDRTWSLAGLRLEAGDGSSPGRWTLKWTGVVGDSIGAGGRFLIGGAAVLPAPDAVASLDLQNGPDAVRLVWPDGASEVVGYGVHEFSEYACGEPAPDAPSGSSLARVPDGADLGSNALDFRVATPSPGRANQTHRNVALLRGSLALEPEQPAPEERARLGVSVVNRGAEALAGGEVRIEVRVDDAARLIGSAVIDAALASDDSLDVTIELEPLAAGRHLVQASARLLGDGDPADDVDSLRVRVGPGPLAVTEIQFHPLHGEGEWVEVWNRTPDPVAIAGLRLADRLDRPGTPELGLDPLAPESLAVLAQDRAALLTRFPALDAGRVWQVRPWASLNNSDDSAGVADIVILRDADGTPCERRPYSASGVPAGVPLERRGEGSFWPALEQDGTPLAFPSAPAPLAGRLAVAPRRLAPGATARLDWSLPWDSGRVTIELYDLAGRRVGKVARDLAVAGRGGLAWRADTPAGVYVLVLQATDAARDQRLVASTPLRVEAR